MATDTTHVVHHLCQYMQANLGRRVRLSELQDVSSLSPRTLQYAFQRVHGCSPMQWLRRQRLEHARRMLVAGEVRSGITGVAFECGFPHPSLFSRDYAALYGELPSETLRKVRRVP